MSLKEILGHSSLKMVERYSHLTSAYKRKILNRLPSEFNDCHIFAINQSEEELTQNKKALQT